MTVNRATLIGNLGADPEIRTANSGTAIGNLRIATSHRTKDRDGNWGEETTWHTVVIFGKTAENCARFLKKGRTVYVDGRIQTRKWEDKEGQTRYTTEIVANEIKFLGGREGGSGGGSGGGYPGGGGGSSDIPFAP